jgi:hypothetical protein
LSCREQVFVSLRLEAGLEAPHVNLVFAYQLPEGAAVFVRSLRGLCDVAVVGDQKFLNVCAFKLCDEAVLRLFE